MSSKNSARSREHQFLKLTLEFPWLWALRSSWHFSPECGLPSVERASDTIVEESLWRETKWWMVCERTSGDGIVSEVCEMKTHANVGEEMWYLVNDSRFLTQVLYLVSLKGGSGQRDSQQFTIYKPKAMESDLNYLCRFV